MNDEPDSPSSFIVRRSLLFVRELLGQLIADIEVAVDLLDVVEVFQLLDQLERLKSVGDLRVDRGLSTHILFSTRYRQAGSQQRLAYCGELLEIGVDLNHIFAD